jgi:hypothetical protein
MWRFAEDGLLTDDTGRLSTLGPRRIRAVTVLEPKAVHSASGNQLNDAVSLRVALSRPQTCANLVVKTVERKSNGTTGAINTVYNQSPAAAAFNVTIPVGSRTNANDATWVIHVEQGAGLPYSPTATFRT